MKIFKVVKDGEVIKSGLVGYKEVSSYLKIPMSSIQYRVGVENGEWGYQLLVEHNGVYEDLRDYMSDDRKSLDEDKHREYRRRYYKMYRDSHKEAYRKYYERYQMKKVKNNLEKIEKGEQL